VETVLRGVGLRERNVRRGSEIRRGRGAENLGSRRSPGVRFPGRKKKLKLGGEVNKEKKRGGKSKEGGSGADASLRGGFWFGLNPEYRGAGNGRRTRR